MCDRYSRTARPLLPAGGRADYELTGGLRVCGEAPVDGRGDKAAGKIPGNGEYVRERKAGAGLPPQAKHRRQERRAGTGGGPKQKAAPPGTLAVGHNQRMMDPVPHVTGR